MVFGGATNIGRSRCRGCRGEGVPPRAGRRGMPMLGVCLGAQLLAEAAGGSVRRARAAGDRLVEVALDAGDDPLMGGLPERFTAFGGTRTRPCPPTGRGARAQRRLPAGVPAGGTPAVGDPVPRRGLRRPTAPLDRALPHGPRRGRLGSTPRRCWPRASRGWTSGTSWAAALCARFLDAADAMSTVRGRARDCSRRFEADGVEGALATSLPTRCWRSGPRRPPSPTPTRASQGGRALLRRLRGRARRSALRAARYPRGVARGGDPHRVAERRWARPPVLPVEQDSADVLRGPRAG